MELNWVPDYCLACDKQIESETYCSQSCRLADLEKSSNWSGSASPTTPAWTSSESNRGSGFYLSPAFNFAAYKTPPQATPDWPASGQSASQQNSYFSASSITQNASSRTLSPSSSRSSLNSTTTSSSSTSSHQNPLSEETRTELRGYTNSFDSTRNWRRRMTWS